MLFKVSREFRWLFLILVPVTFTLNSCTIYFFGIYILSFLFTFEIVLICFFSSFFSFFSKRFRSLFSSLTKVYEKFMVNLLISYFKYSHRRCLSVILPWSSMRRVSEIWFFIFFYIFSIWSERIIKFPKAFSPSWHIF